MPNGQSQTFDWDSFLEDLYESSLPGLGYVPETQRDEDTPPTGGYYTYSDDTLELLKQACSDRGGTWDEANDRCNIEPEVSADPCEDVVCEEGQQCFNGVCVTPGEYSTDFQTFMDTMNLGGFCEGGTGGTQAACEDSGGNWSSFYDPDTGGVFGENLYQWLQDAFGMPEGYEEYFATLQFPMENFLELLQELPEVEKLETELITRAYNISQEERERQQGLIEEAYRNGYLSLSERDELIQKSYNLAEQAYRDKVGIEEQRVRIEQALSDGTISREEYDSLLDQFGQFEGAIFQNMQNAINRSIEQKLQRRSEAGEALTSATEAAQSRYTTGMASEEARQELGKTQAGFEKEMGELRSRRDFLNSFENVRGTLLQQLPMAREILGTQFRAAGAAENIEERAYRKSRDALGTIVGQTYLPELGQIAEKYGFTVEEIEKEYEVRTGAIEIEYGEEGRVRRQADRQFDILMGTCDNDDYGTRVDCEAAEATWTEGVIEREFGLNLDEISDEAQQSMDVAELRFSGDKLARDEALQVQDARRRDIEFRRNQADSGLLTDAEIDQLRKDEAIWNLRQAMDERLAGVESFINDWLRAVMDQYGFVRGLDIGDGDGEVDECPSGEKRCPDNSCIPEDDTCPPPGIEESCEEQCSHLSGETRQNCIDRCVSEGDDVCPQGQKMCQDGNCIPNGQECPCPEGQTRCPEGSDLAGNCKKNINDCNFDDKDCDTECGCEPVFDDNQREWYTWSNCMEGEEEEDLCGGRCDENQECVPKYSGKGEARRRTYECVDKEELEEDLCRGVNCEFNEECNPNTGECEEIPIDENCLRDCDEEYPRGGQRRLCYEECKEASEGLRIRSDSLLAGLNGGLGPGDIGLGPDIGAGPVPEPGGSLLDDLSGRLLP